MKTILCFGDSNTWGYSPTDGGRYPKSKRWPGIVDKLLSDKVKIVEEGLPGRTTLFNDPSAGFVSGKEALHSCLKKHTPDVVILMLGTNDLKENFDQSARDISENVATLIEEIKNHSKASNLQLPTTVMVAPPEIDEVGHFGQFFSGGKEKSKHFSENYRQQADKSGCLFFDSNKHVNSSPIDGVHWEADQHQNMANAIAIKLEEDVI